MPVRQRPRLERLGRAAHPRPEPQFIVCAAVCDPQRFAGRCRRRRAFGLGVPVDGLCLHRLSVEARGSNALGCRSFICRRYMSRISQEQRNLLAQNFIPARKSIDVRMCDERDEGENHERTMLTHDYILQLKYMMPPLNISLQKN
ncbi:hypothetical protein ABW21_db0205053 [Orbilia brochopaga]|nr:hypothetical protein ABW21_db0205053 [Drechslerella brochopaga]